MSRPAPRMEEAARLYYIDGLSYVEIATQMEIGTETVKTHLRWFRANNGLGNRREAVAWFRDQPKAVTVQKFGFNVRIEKDRWVCDYCEQPLGDRAVTTGLGYAHEECDPVMQLIHAGTASQDLERES